MERETKIVFLKSTWLWKNLKELYRCLEPKNKVVFCLTKAWDKYFANNWYILVLKMRNDYKLCLKEYSKYFERYLYHAQCELNVSCAENCY